MNTTGGLEGVAAGSTRLSLVRGGEGRLSYAGYGIEDLAARATFEDVCHLLWHGSLPDATASGRLAARLLENMAVDDRILETLRGLAKAAHPMAVLQTAISAIGCTDPDAEDAASDIEMGKAIRLTAQTGTLAAAIGRFRAGRLPVQPRALPGLAANFLYMLHEREPEPAVARALDVALVLHADHGMNASTLAARVAAGTMADMHSAVGAAIGVLRGPLHGGAAEHVMRMLVEIGSPDRAATWIRGALDRGQRIMGFGHHEYRTIDPRAPILESLARSLVSSRADAMWLDIAAAIRDVMEFEMAARGRQVRPNVDFYSAPLYHMIGIPAELFPCVFAFARMPGWTAHIMEQREHDRPIRASIEYTGPDDRTIEERVSRT